MRGATAEGVRQAVNGGIAARVHHTPKGRIVGACDAELLGRRIVEGELALEITEKFYAGLRIGPGELMPILEDCLTANLIGARTVLAYCKENPEAKESVITVGGVPHLQVFRL